MSTKLICSWYSFIAEFCEICFIKAPFLTLQLASISKDLQNEARKSYFLRKDSHCRFLNSGNMFFWDRTVQVQVKIPENMGGYILNNFLEN